MIIKKIDIESFGKFSGRSFSFKPGFNLIFGKNEAGKSTIMSFIKLMFYGYPKKTGDISKNIRKKYSPWNGSHMSGSIEFETTDGSFRLHKDFQKTVGRDIVSVFNISKGENLSLSPLDDIGKTFFDMDVNEFERSVFVEAFGGFSSEGSGNSLAMRIGNLSVTGNEDISQATVLSRLSAAKEELISKSGKKGLLVDAQKKAERLKYELDLLNTQTESQYSLMSEINSLKKDILALEQTLDSAEAAHKAEKAKKEFKAMSELWKKLDSRDNLLKSMSAWDKDITVIKELYLRAKELRKKIPETDFAQSALFTPEDYQKILELETKLSALKKDEVLLSDKIQAAFNNATAVFVAEQKRNKRNAAILSALVATLLILSIILLFLRHHASFYVLTLSAILTISPLSRIWKRVFKSDLVTSCFSEYKTSLQQLSFFSEDILKKSPEEIKIILASKQHKYTLILKDFLQKFNCSSIEEFKAGAVENLGRNEIAKNAEHLKLQFIQLICRLEGVSSFEEADTVLKAVRNSLLELDGINREISAVASAMGIDKISTAQISERMSSLSEFIESVPYSEVCDTQIVKQELLEKRQLLGELQSRITPPSQDENLLSAQLAEAEAVLKTLSDRYKSLSIALDTLETAISETNKGLGSLLSNKTGEYLQKMTAGKYSDVLVSRNLSVEARSSLSDGYHEWKYLSSGTIDRVYLALRLAATDIIAKSAEPLPLFLDDVLAQYDDESCRDTLRFLKYYLKNIGSVSQIIFFTCHKHIADMAMEIFSDLNEIIL